MSSRNNANIDNDGVKLFMKVMQLIQMRGNEVMDKVYVELFNHPKVVEYIFAVLGKEFNTLWKDFIIILKPGRIATNKRILMSFRINLQRQIGRLQSKDGDKLKDLFDLIVHFESKNTSSRPLDKSKLMKAGKEENCKLCDRKLKSGLFHYEKTGIFSFKKVDHGWGKQIHHCRFWYVSLFSSYIVSAISL